MKKGINVLFIYPNTFGMNMLPPAVGLLSSCLKREGFEVDLFDTTYYDKLDGDSLDSDKSKTDRLMARPFRMPHELAIKYSNVFDDFVKKVESYSPDLIALSATEDMFELGVQLLEKVKHHKILTIAGDVFPTFAPNLVLNFDVIDIVCKGEGEIALVELCKRIESGRSYDNVNNLWVKNNKGNIGVIIKIEKSSFIDVECIEWDYPNIIYVMLSTGIIDRKCEWEYIVLKDMFK